MKTLYTTYVKTKISFAISIVVFILMGAFLTQKFNKPTIQSDADTLNDFYLILLENRLSYARLATLDPASVKFFDDYSTTRTTIRESNASIREMLNQEDNTIDPDLSAKTLNIANRQLTLLDEIDALESAVTAIFQYDPSIDFDQSNEENAVLLESANSAINGITGILRTLDSNEELLKPLIAAGNTTVASLQELSSSLQGDDEVAIQKNITQTVDQFNILRQSAFDTQLAIIRSQESVSMLTDLTNLLLDIKNTIN